MPIFVEWKWVEKTKTFLAVFHFWDDEKKTNLRMRLEKEYEAFETCAYNDSGEEEGEFVPIETFPGLSGGPGDSKTRAYLSWAPSHPEFCLLTELLTYANLLNGMKINDKEKFRPMLQGKTGKQEIEGHEYISFQISSKLLHSMLKGRMISFAGQRGISFEVCLEYVEYLRELLKPYLQS